MKIYFVGIKGVGMTALAQILQAQGHEISGSDVAEDFVTKAALRKLGIKISEFDARNITPALDLVVHSNAFKMTHPELRAAQQLGLKIQNYPQALATIFNKKRGVAVAGTHGKTTVSALLGHTLAQAGADPTCLIGAPVLDFGRCNARVGASDLFVIEACEYQNSFHNYHPHAAILTNIDYDHPDFFPDRRAYEQSFAKFVENVAPDGVVILRQQDVQKISHPRCVTFALTDKNADWSAAEIAVANQEIHFAVFHRGEFFGNFTLKIPGEHNVENALAVVALAHELGFLPAQIRAGLESFRGTARRQENCGSVLGAPVIDDYAHHPQEIRATLAALADFYPELRVVVIFQSHTHTRTRALLDDFAQSFGKADLLFLPEIFPSAREQDFAEKVSAAELVAEIQKHRPGLKIVAGSDLRTAADFQNYAKKVREQLRAGDLVVTLGAGETDKLAAELVLG